LQKRFTRAVIVAREKKNSTDGVKPGSEEEKRRVLSEFARKKNIRATPGAALQLRWPRNVQGVLPPRRRTTTFPPSL
jgi:hypothetical protein